MGFKENQQDLLTQILTDNFNIKGRRVVNAGNAQGNQDYITKYDIINPRLAIQVPDIIYGASWDGSFLVPTQNAVYDKIENLISSIKLTSLVDYFTSQGNVTTSETDLYTTILAASQLVANGDKLEVEYGGVFVSSATATRQLKIYFGGSIIFDSGALTLSLSSAWTIYTSVIRVSSSVIRYMISMTTEGAALAAYTAVGELTGLTLSNTQVLKITGQAAGVGAATNDIVAKLGKIIYVKAA